MVDFIISCSMQKWYECRSTPDMAQTATADNDVPNATAELKTLQQEVQQQQQIIQRQRTSLQKAYTRTHSIKKKYGRRSVAHKKETSAANARQQELREQLCIAKAQLSATEKAKNAETRLKNVYKVKYTAARQEAMALRSKLKKLESKLATAEQKLNQSQQTQPQQSKNIQTMAGRPPQYTDTVRQCCLELLAHNVGTNHVAPVISSVIHNLTDNRIERLPSPAKMCAFLGEAKQLVLTQIGEKLMSEDNLTLHRDGTTKQGTKYYGAQVASQAGVMDIGLSAVALSEETNSTNYYSAPERKQ